MAPLIKEILAKKLVGKRLQMSLLQDKTAELWKSFMPQRKQIKGVLSQDLFSVQVFDYNSFKDFNGNTLFEKWAAMEVNDFTDVPDTMEEFILPAGLYAVFIHKGSQRDFNYIYRDWLPSSGYTLDNRPHFAVMGEKYRSDDPASEEEIWIPIKLAEQKINLTYDWVNNPNR